jgi:hypothetical protein
MYSLKTFASALTLATAKPTRRYFSVTAEQGRELTHYINHVVANAAQIALAGPADSLSSLAHVDLIQQAAHRLAELEQSAGFDWAKTNGTDWETTCAKIGAFIAEHGEAPTPETLQLYISGTAA